MNLLVSWPKFVKDISGTKNEKLVEYTINPFQNITTHSPSKSL